MEAEGGDGWRRKEVMDGGGRRRWMEAEGGDGWRRKEVMDGSGRR